LQRLKGHDIAGALAAIVLCELAGLVGAVFTTPSIPTWYATLRKPSFNPPSWIFAPVWLILYMLMGISLFLIWRKGIGTPQIMKDVCFFGIQLALNVLWSVVFFGLHSVAYGFVTIIVLLVAILTTILAFNRTSRTAAVLLVPYLLWGSFATILNFSILLLNI
jgi:tryptophan-rich sensory protein